jgi:sortase (surface protein transpeptidase)
MITKLRPPRSRGRRLLGALLVLVGTAGAAVAAAPVRGHLDQQVAPGDSALTVETAGGSAAVPTDLEIPVIDVRSHLVRLVVDGSGALQAPDDPDVAGWFAAGVVPGDTGPSVIGGHVDSKTGPGIFYALGRLTAGDRVMVHRSDGRTPTFQVTTVTQLSKSSFPTQLVYGPTPGPELRLVTCGGRFDRDRRSYLDNVVVEAVLV